MTEEHITLAATLGIVGGFVILIYGAVEIYYGVNLQTISTLGGLPVMDTSTLTVAGGVGVAVGLLIAILSGFLGVLPESHVGLGVMVILFAFVSLVSVGGGNGVGFLLSVLGGACAIAFSEEEVRVVAQAVPPSMANPSRPSILGQGSGSIIDSSEIPLPELTPREPTLRGCRHCGRTAPSGSAFCPSCGSRFD